MREVHLRSPRVKKLDQSKNVAWYDVKGKGWLRDTWVLSHFPYTCWHLSYAVIGAALAQVMNWPLLGWTVLAFFLGMGIAGHCLDELNGRPLKTTLPTWILWLLTGLGLGGALTIGIVIGVNKTVWVIPCIVFGAFIVFAYNMELGKGFFHRDIWFGLAWGAFPAVTAYVAQDHTLSLAAILMALFALLSSMAQRKLSLQSRFWRRKVVELSGRYYVEGEGSVVPGTVSWNPGHDITKQVIIGPADLALKYLNGAVVVVAIALLLMRM
jgi:hypothetical protein